jgi:NADH-quinone oxidoreductase subunit I
VRFEIDYSRCVFCGLCVEACPEDAIRMAPEVPALTSGDRHQMWLTMDEMLTWKPQRDAAKPYPPRPAPAPVQAPVQASPAGKEGAS